MKHPQANNQGGWRIAWAQSVLWRGLHSVFSVVIIIYFRWTEAGITARYLRNWGSVHLISWFINFDGEAKSPNERRQVTSMDICYEAN